MKRGLPILLVLLLTVLSAGGAYGVNVIIRRVVSPPELAEKAPSVASGRSTPMPVRPRALSAEQYLDGIMGRNLFDVEVIAAWAARKPRTGGAAGSLARSELKVKLLGTVVANPESFSSALIADEEDPFPKGYSIGDKLYDREVVKIEKKRVTLRGPDGKIEVITVDDEMEVNPPSSVASTEGEGEGGVEASGENRFTVSKDLFDKYINDVESISRMGRALLHRGPDGEFDGYRLSAIRRNTLADQLGIKNGDIIHSVNGEGLSSVQAAMNAYNTMKTQSNFCFEITRRGSPMELCYDVR